MTEAISTTSTRPAISVPAERYWPPGPRRPLLAEGAVHVWRADLKTVDAELGELLCSDERARAERFPRERDGQLWRRSRGVLRALLGRYLGVDGRVLRFATGAHGKPALLGESPISFNLSLSGDLALYAFSGVGAVGVDVQVTRRSLDELALTARAFGRAEARRLEGLDPSLRELEFLRLWTRLEAKLKCRGTGIGGGPGAIGREPWIAELDMGSRAARGGGGGAPRARAAPLGLA